MIKVMQFGEGNFLRTFVDLYLDTLNKENIDKYEVYIVKSVPFGSLEKFKLQNNKYHVVLRGRLNGKDVEDIYHVDSIKDTVDLFINDKLFFDLAKDKNTRIIVSNTTEAGICFDNKDKIDAFPNITYPAKLTIWLYQRFLAKLPNVHILPVELIDNNASELFKCVEAYINLWNLGEDFKNWNKNNYYCNTLVDRIVSGFPKDEETKNHLYELVGTKDELLSIGEPFGLWVIEKRGDICRLLRDGHHNIDVIFAEDISYYKRRKVRVLNGSHTNMMPIALWHNKVTVFDVLNDEKLKAFVFCTLQEDIIPFVGEDVEATTKFANEVIDRFLNPYLNHQLASIALNSISKWKARDLCSFVDYYQKHHHIPKYLTIGFAYLINMYQHIEKCDDKYICHLPQRDIEVRDEEKYMNYFVDHNVNDFLSDVAIWGMDLTKFNDLEETTKKYLTLISKGVELI